MANGTIKKGSLVKNTGGSGGGGNVEFKTSIYATDNAYIQTDISMNENYKIRVTGKRNKSYNSTNYLYIFGGSKSSGSYPLGTDCYFSYSSGASKNVVAILTYNGTGYPPTSSASHYFGSDDFDLSLNAYTNNTVSFTIFCSNSINGFLNDYVSLSLIEIKDQNDNLLHELKPAIVNGESGMYDTVTQTFYGNANSVGSLVCE